jgi:cytoskeletal protein CcmA (bactofilin family)
MGKMKALTVWMENRQGTLMAIEQTLSKANILSFLNKRTWLKRGESPNLSVKRTLENRTVFCADCDANRLLTVSALGNLICSSCGSRNWMHLPNRSPFINGQIKAEEDLTADGCVERKIELEDRHFVVDLHGSIHAEIHAKHVTIRGNVVGNIYASGLVEIKASASVVGNIKASRISLADGARFKGSIDTEIRTETTTGLDLPKAASAQMGHNSSLGKLFS